MNWNDVIPHLNGLLHVATADSGGAPHISKVAAAVDGATIWIATMRTSGKARNVAANPRVALMWDSGSEAYVWGDAELVDDIEEKRRIWDSGLLPYDPAMFFGTVDNPLLVLLRVTPTRATVLTMGPDGGTRGTWSA